MVKKKYNITLPTVDDLFTTQEERDDAGREKVVELPLDELHEFPGHPFKVTADDADMMELVDSIKQYGVLVPGLARPRKDGGHEIVSGHRRMTGSKLAGLDTMPFIVRELTDDEAILIMVDSNLQREKILPSEKAFAYKMKLDAMKRQGKRMDLTSPPTSPPLVEKLKRNISTAVIGEQTGDSHEQVRRYIRLTELVPALLGMVDEGKLAFRPAVELSYLPAVKQRMLYEVMTENKVIPSLAQAVEIKRCNEMGFLKKEVMLSIMKKEKPNKEEQIKVPKSRIERFFTAGEKNVEIEETIVKALELYFSAENRTVLKKK